MGHLNGSTQSRYGLGGMMPANVTVSSNAIFIKSLAVVSLFEVPRVVASPLGYSWP
jgi:hypothetical protein